MINRSTLALAAALLLGPAAHRAATPGEKPAKAPSPAAASPDAQSQADAPPPPEPDPFRPPPGTPADQELWKTMVDVQNRALGQRQVAANTLWKLHRERPDQKLDEQGRKAPADEARLQALKKRLLESWDRTHTVLNRPWSVNPRLGCRIERLDLGTAMEGNPSYLPRVREAALECLSRHSAALQAMEGANAELLGLIAEAEAALGGRAGGKQP